MNKEKNDFTKVFGIITFSANAQMVLTPEKVKKVAALVNSMNEFNREFAGEAFIQIMEGKTKMYDGKDALRDLNAYAHFHRKEEQMELEMRANYECPLINEVALKSNRQRSRRIDMYEIIVLERSGTFQHYFVRGVLQ